MILSGNIEEKNYYLKKYQETEESKDTYLGKAKVFTNPHTLEKVIAVHERYTDQETLRNKVQSIQQFMLEQSSYNLKLLDYEVKVDSHWSKCIYNLFVFYENFEETLSEKMKMKKIFTEEELIEILYAGLHCLKEMQNSQKYHGDLRPENLVCLNNGIYKVMVKYDC